MDKLLAGLPELGNSANVRGQQMAQIGSESVNNETLMMLGKRVPARVKQADADGIVVTPGTDTLEETAYFTNFVIRTSKSMGMGGSRRPGTALFANGALNLFYAPSVAASNDAAFKSRRGALGIVVEGNNYWFRVPVKRHTAQSAFNIDDFETQASAMARWRRFLLLRCKAFTPRAFR